MTQIGSIEYGVEIQDSDVDRSLAAINARVEGSLRKIDAMEAKVQIGANLKELNRDLKLATAKVKEFEAEQKRADRAGEDQRGAANRLRAARAELEIKKEAVRVAEQAGKARNQEINDLKFMQARHQVLAQAERERGRVARENAGNPLKERVQVLSLQREYASLTDELEKLNKARKGAFTRETKQKIDIDSQFTIAKMELLKKSLSELGAHPPVHVKVDAEWTSLRGIGQKLAGAFEKLGNVGNLRLNLGPLSGTIRTFGIALATLGPVVTSVTAAVGALVGVVGTALAGAGAIGAAALVGMGASAAGLLLTIKPLAAQFKIASQSTAAYNKAVLQYGAGSKQATVAQQKMNSVLKGVSPEVAKAAREVGKFQAAWAKATGGSGGAQRQLGGILADGFKAANALLPTLAKGTNELSKNMRSAFSGIFDQLSSAGAQRGLGTIMGNFNKAIVPALGGVQNLGTAFGRIAVSASRFLKPTMDAFQHLTQHFADSTANSGKLNAVLDRLYSHAQSLMRFFGAAGKVLVDFFNAGANSGKNLVDKMTAALNRWDAFIRSTKGQHDLKEFFDRGVTGTLALTHAIAPLLKSFLEWSNVLQPVTSGILTFVSWISRAIGAVTHLTAAQGPLKALGITLGALWATTKIAAFVGFISNAVGILGRFAASLLGVAAAEQAVAAGEAEMAAGSAAMNFSALGGGAATATRTVSGLAVAETEVAAGATAARGGMVGLLAGIGPVLGPMAALAASAAAAYAAFKGLQAVAPKQADIRKIKQDIPGTPEEAAHALDQYSKDKGPFHPAAQPHDTRHPGGGPIATGGKGPTAAVPFGIASRLNQAVGTGDVAAIQQIRARAKAEQVSGQLTRKEYQATAAAAEQALGRINKLKPNVAAKFKYDTEQARQWVKINGDQMHLQYQSIATKIRTTLNQLPPDQLRIGRKAADNLINEAQRAGLITTREARKMHADVNVQYEQLAKAAGLNATRAANATVSQFARAHHLSAAQVRALKNAVGGDVNQLADAVSGKMSAMTEALNAQLQKLGVASVHFTAGQFAGDPGHVRAGQARGGVATVGKKGQAGGDNVPVNLLVGKGEQIAVFNRHQQSQFNRTVPGGLEGFFAGASKRPHYMAYGGPIEDPQLHGGGDAYLHQFGQTDMSRYSRAENAVYNYIKAHMGFPDGVESWGGGHVADWIGMLLTDAAKHGVHIGLSDLQYGGFRTFAMQKKLFDSGEFAAPPGIGRHEGHKFPDGAADLSGDFGGLASFISSQPKWRGKFANTGAAHGDSVHWSYPGSVPGKASFAEGGVVQKMASGGIVKTGATVDPGGDPKQQAYGGMSYAELEATPGFANYSGGGIRHLLGKGSGPTGLPMGYPLWVSRDKNKWYKIWKSDNGDGAGNAPHSTVDLHGKIAGLLGISKGDIYIADGHLKNPRTAALITKWDDRTLKSASHDQKYWNYMRDHNYKAYAHWHSNYGAARKAYDRNQGKLKKKTSAGSTAAAPAARTSRIPDGMYGHVDYLSAAASLTDDTGDDRAALRERQGLDTGLINQIAPRLDLQKRLLAAGRSLFGSKLTASDRADLQADITQEETDLTALYGDLKTTNDTLGPLDLNAFYGINTQSGIAGAGAGGSSGADTADIQAQLTQSQTALAAARQSGLISDAFNAVAGGPGSIGQGGFLSARQAAQQTDRPTIIIQTLHPGDPATLSAVANAAVSGMDYQGGRTSPRDRVF